MTSTSTSNIMRQPLPDRDMYLYDPENRHEGWICLQKPCPVPGGFVVCDFENDGRMVDKYGNRQACGLCHRVWVDNPEDRWASSNFYYCWAETPAKATPDAPDKTGNP